MLNITSTNATNRQNLLNTTTINTTYRQNKTSFKGIGNDCFKAIDLDKKDFTQRLSLLAEKAVGPIKAYFTTVRIVEQKKGNTVILTAKQGFKTLAKETATLHPDTVEKTASSLGNAHNRILNKASEFNMTQREESKLGGLIIRMHNDSNSSLRGVTLTDLFEKYI